SIAHTARPAASIKAVRTLARPKALKNIAATTPASAPAYQTGPRRAASSVRSPAIVTARSRGVTRASDSSATSALGMLLLENSKSFEKAFVRAQRALDGGRAGRADGVVPLRAPAPLGRRLAEARRHEALLLEPVQGRVERAGRGAPPGAA